NDSAYNDNADNDDNDNAYNDDADNADNYGNGVVRNLDKHIDIYRSIV
ncbi:MAG: hypothetical protein GX948_05630, partial [Clostridiaceae bacterium]|nr:hypothetical protein [Clostridiaceae bacterium]